MKAEVKEKKEIAKGTLLIKFDVSDKEISFRPGQFFFITLLNPPYNDERGSQRHFTIVNSPNEEDTITMTTRIRDSAFKKSLYQISIGTEVEIGDISGSFSLPDQKFKKLVFIAGGIGITPFISMLRYIIEENLDYQVTLLYSNRNKESTAFLEELEDMVKNNKNIELVLTMTDDSNWSGENRMIDPQFIKEYISKPNSYFYLISGPPAMVEATYNALLKVEVKDEKIKTENFSGY